MAPREPVTVDRLVDVLDLFNQDHREGLSALEPLYTEDMRFRDPLQVVQGRDAFMKMMRDFVKVSRELRFEPDHWAQTGDQIFVTWHMTWVLKRGPALHIDGVTHARLRGGRIDDHRDYWDVLEGVTGALPPLQLAYKKLLSKLV